MKPRADDCSGLATCAHCAPLLAAKLAPRPALTDAEKAAMWDRIEVGTEGWWKA